MDAQTKDRIQSVIDANDIVLFMKGTPDQPRCGFSATIVQILGCLGVPFKGVDVLADPGIRDGIKEFSDWPTIPQLYVRKEFVGGCDIVKDMYGSGELEEKLGVAAPEVAPPAITVTPKAVEALRASLESPEEGVRFEVGPKFEYGLSIGTRGPRDVIVDAGGLSLFLDRPSAQRANGTIIDFVTTPEGTAFKIENPNEPPKVKQMAPRTLADRLKSGEALNVYDVRTPAEREQASIDGTVLLDRAAQDAIMKLPKETPLVFHCHHGGRSQQAAEHFLGFGFKNVFNLSGGIDAWSVEVDPKVPRY
jgi:monothiol glutaredoxin